MLRLWRYNAITGYWHVARSVTTETAAAWLAVFEKAEPGVLFKISKRKPH